MSDDEDTTMSIFQLRVWRVLVEVAHVGGCKECRAMAARFVLMRLDKGVGIGQ